MKNCAEKRRKQKTLCQQQRRHKKWRRESGTHTQTQRGRGRELASNGNCGELFRRRRRRCHLFDYGKQKAAQKVKQSEKSNE